MPIKEDLICDGCKKTVYHGDQKNSGYLLECGHDLCHECLNKRGWKIWRKKGEYCFLCNKKVNILKKIGGE